MTVRLVLVRHGRAAAGWDTHPDPALDDVGRAQARFDGLAQLDVELSARLAKGM